MNEQEYNAIKENIRRGISTQTLSPEDQDRFWTLLMGKCKSPIKGIPRPRNYTKENMGRTEYFRQYNKKRWNRLKETAAIDNISIVST